MDPYASEQLRQTRQLIDREPTTLQMRRRSPVTKSAAGGVRRGPDEVDQDPIRVFFAAKMRDGLPMQDSQGERVVQFYVIVAEPGTDIQTEDMFTVNGLDYKVTFVHTNLSYELKADVETVSRGR